MGHRRSQAVLCVAWAALPALALAGCPSVDLGDSPPDIGLCNPAKGEAFFESDVWPKYLNDTAAPTKQCTKGGCHNQTGVSALRFTTDPVDLPANYKASLVDLNCGDPAASLLLVKPLAGTEPHGGGDIYPDVSDPAVVTFLDWFTP